VSISKTRQKELIQLASAELSSREYFNYHDWDGLIECDELMTADELDWLYANATVEVTVKVKQ
jgi:hypothetical protein